MIDILLRYLLVGLGLFFIEAGWGLTVAWLRRWPTRQLWRDIGWLLLLWVLAWPILLLVIVFRLLRR